MAHGQFHEPAFDFDLFRSSVAEWAAAGAKQVAIEWLTGPGPTVVWYPQGARKLGKFWRFEAAPTQYSERYADYLEYDLMPQLEDIARENRLQARVECVDQQPIQVMRMRRRELEIAERASS